MTRDEAIQYIRSHPAMFKGASEDEVLSKTQSSNDANYYNPTTFDSAQKATVVKPNTATRGATVSASRTTQTAPKISPGGTTAGLPATNALVGKFKGANLLPWVLGFGVIGLGAGMAIYKVSR
jgi:hypothetical protein